MEGEQLAKAVRAADEGVQGARPLDATIVKIVQGSDERKGIYRISVPFPAAPPMLPHGFTFNQFLLVDDKPLLWHTGMKGTFPAVAAAVERVMPLSDLAYIGYAHCEADECGAMNLLLEAAPNATAISSHVEVATYGSDAFVRRPLALDDGAELCLGDMTVQYLWTPHTPHGWGTGFLFERRSRTLFAGDLFTQHGIDLPAVREPTDVKAMDLKLFDITDYWVWHGKSAAHLERLAALQPSTLLVMHGSSFQEPALPPISSDCSTALPDNQAGSAAGAHKPTGTGDDGSAASGAPGGRLDNNEAAAASGGLSCAHMIQQLGELRQSFEGDNPVAA